MSYSDGYRTFGSMIVPTTVAPVCGWPLVVFVHPLGTSRAVDLGLQVQVAAQGFAVWSYDVRGQGQAIAANVNHPQAGTTLWGAIELCDLGEQIRFVGQSPQWVGVVDATHCAVVGSSQGGAHAWAAAAWSGRSMVVPGRTPSVFPTVACVVANDYIAETAESWIRDGSLWNSWFVEVLAGSFSGFELDPTLLQAGRAAFLAQDPAPLLAAFTAEGRDLAADLGASQVPILYTHAYHDRIDSPLSGVRSLLAAGGPGRAVLTTGGPHNAVANDRERAGRDGLILRWLKRWLWNELDESELEDPFVLAELPVEAGLRDDRGYPWNHHHGGDPLQAASPTRLWLHGDSSLQTQAGTPAQPVATIEQMIAPSAAFSPQDYLDVPATRQLVNLLAACPLDEEVYAITLADEWELAASASARLRLVPFATDWMIAALLSVQPPGAPEVMLVSGCVHATASTIGVAEEHDLLFSPIAARIPAGSTVRLRLRNLWLRESPLDRQLEVAPRFHDFRVDIVHGTPASGSYLDLPLEPVRPKIVSAATWFDLQTASPLLLQVRAGVARAHQPYYITFGISGHLPATPFLNDIMPLESDWLVGIISTSRSRPELIDFFGELDAGGNATAVVDFRAYAPLPAELAGLRLSFAAFVFDSFVAMTGAATNPCDVFLR
ncbi:MAG: hypothetical protein KDC98_19780 [Planctomycetes bacterium]|nr:hypothetical protein [Planctomycetota bacterium]